MKVGIDTFGLDHGQSGLGAYLYFLMQNMPFEEGIEYDLFGVEADRYTYKAKFDTGYTPVDIKETQKYQQHWHKRRVNRFAKKNKYDVVLFTAATQLLPKRFYSKGIAIVNDIVSEIFQDKKDRYLRHYCLNGLKRINRIIAPSEYVKNDLVSLGIESWKIAVIPNGIDHSVFYQQNLADGDYVDIKPFAIKKPYIIYPTRISDPEKYHKELIRAFDKFKSKTGLPYRLVLAGALDDYAGEVQNAILDSPYASDIFMTGYFTHSELGRLYSNAECCVFPSSKEGVGLPVIETMACGIPAACAERGAIPEISGKNVVMFNPDNIDEMAQAIEKVTTDQSLRHDMIQKGLQWAKNYTWENTAIKVLDVIKSLR